MHADTARDSHFWDHYIEILQDAAVPDKSRRWYVVRIERYLAAHPQPLTEHTADTVRDYLSQAGRDPQIPAWLFRQLVHALQLLFTQHLNAPWATEIDWVYWTNSSHELEATHPTVARYNTPMKGVTSPAQSKNTDSKDTTLNDAEPKEEKKEKNKKEKNKKERESTHAQVFVDMAAEIRRRGYSIRTERAYVAWAQRSHAQNSRAA